MQKSFKAQLATEDGLQFMLQTISGVELPKETAYDTLMTNLSVALGAILDETPNLGDSVVSGTETTVTIPPITVGDTVFSCTLTRLAPNAAGDQQCNLSVTGSASGMSRAVSLDLSLSTSPPSALDHGIASRGTIEICNSAEVLSMGKVSDASVFSTSGASTVIQASNNAKIAGDLYICAADATFINLTGSVEIGGESDDTAILTNNTHYNRDSPEFPTFDLTPFPALTTEVITSSTKTSGGKTFNNVHILPNADPRFTGNTTLNGIVYIEAPNNVTFIGSLVINGLVVTSDGSALPLSGNQITFAGNVSMPGVDALPDTEEFAEVKKLKGTAILAPGFGVTFTGSNDGINGMIAADQLTFSGSTDLGGSLTGTILGLSDKPMLIQNSASIVINRPDFADPPAGFVFKSLFKVVSSSYSESTP